MNRITNTKGDRYGTVLIAATHNSADTKILQILLDAGADGNTQGRDSTSLCAACLLKKSDQGQVVELLLEKGADPNIKGGTMDTSLHSATLERYDYQIERLLNYGAERGIESRHGWTPLQCAGATKNLKVVSCWLQEETMKLLPRLMVAGLHAT